jgi:hypothetical protein
MAPRKTAAANAVAGAIKPPITFKEFSKDPVKGLLFIVIVAIGYLYVDIKMTNKEVFERQNAEIREYKAKVDTLQNQMRVLIEQAATANAKIEMLQSLKQIQK